MLMDEDKSRGSIALEWNSVTGNRIPYVRIYWNLKDTMHSKSKAEILVWECESTSTTLTSNHKNK